MFISSLKEINKRLSKLNFIHENRRFIIFYDLLISIEGQTFGFYAIYEDLGQGVSLTSVLSGIMKNFTIF